MKRIARTIIKPVRNLKRCGKCVLFAVLLCAIAVGAYVFNLVATNNFHIVSAGRIYRSGQMNADALARTIRQHGIKTVINLRGHGGSQEWYLEETKIARELGVRHMDFEMNASRDVNDSEMDQILEALANAPKPVLIHCKSGADRTGLVSALWLYSLEGTSATIADRELDLTYCHFPYLFWSGTAAMDRSFDRYVSNRARGSMAGKSSPSAYLAAGQGLE